MSDVISDLVNRHYHPYASYEEFYRGFSAYQNGNCVNPHEANSIFAQAWDHGVEVAMLCVESLEVRHSRT